MHTLPTYPSFFQSSLYLDQEAGDTFVKLPVRRAVNPPPGDDVGLV